VNYRSHCDSEMSRAWLMCMLVDSDARSRQMFLEGEITEDARVMQCLRLRNDLYYVEWGVKLYSLTHSVMQCLMSFL